MMKIKDVKCLSGWENVLAAARSTVGKPDTGSQPRHDKWKHDMLLSEHSPIRALTFKWTWEDLPYWVSVHIVRHKIGIEHFVSTQRIDRTGVDRNSKTQDAPVTHTCIANAAALIAISRKRLCHKASPETRQAWQLVVDAICEIDPSFEGILVKECVYRGFCPELSSCGFADSPAHTEAIESYRP